MKLNIYCYIYHLIKNKCQVSLSTIQIIVGINFLYLSDKIYISNIIKNNFNLFLIIINLINICLVI